MGRFQISSKIETCDRIDYHTTIVNSLYGLFGTSPTCTDDELRRAYRHAIFENHPDRNPNQTGAATDKTKQLTSAYAKLKKLRASRSTGPQDTESECNTKVGINGLEYTIRFSFDNDVNLKDIAIRKIHYRNEWEKFQQNTSDPISALRLVHAAFRAEQQDSLINLLLNPILVDSASLLFSLVQKDDACETVIKWSEILQISKKLPDAIQILEDAFATGAALPTVADRLRQLHYSWAQYSDPTTGIRATPKVRLEHLRRILELGFNYDYIYKMMAEAYYDLGDNEQARIYLHQAYEFNPELSGAVKISRALGFSKPSIPSSKNAKSLIKYKYSRPQQIPSLTKVREWVQSSNWDIVLEFADPRDYSPHVLSKARETHCLIASSLERCKSPKAIEALIALLNSPYWDVSIAAMTSLSKIGDEHTLTLLESFRAGNSRERANLEACISYLRARINNQPSIVIKATPRELLAQAKKAFAIKNYGQARILLENILVNIDQSDPLSFEVTFLLARSCAELNDLRTSIDLIKPLLPNLPEKLRRVVYQELASWLWNDLVFQQYTPINDENYRLALEIHLELVLIGKAPDDVLRNLRKLTRWLELLGAGDIVQWIRQLIRTEAPGTWYVDSHNREHYIRNVDLSPYMGDFLFSFKKRVKTNSVLKLKQVLGSTYNIEDAEFFLDD